MRHWTQLALLLASFPCVANAQVNCDAIPHGPSRTDCYLGLSQFYRGQSDLAAARARAQSDWEQTLRNTNHIGDDRSSDYSRAARGGPEKASITRPLLSTWSRLPVVIFVRQQNVAQMRSPKTTT
jgi:hypothetical protein